MKSIDRVDHASYLGLDFARHLFRKLHEVLGNVAGGERIMMLLLLQWPRMMKERFRVRALGQGAVDLGDDLANLGLDLGSDLLGDLLEIGAQIVLRALAHRRAEYRRGTPETVHIDHRVEGRRARASCGDSFVSERIGLNGPCLVYGQ